MATLMLTQTTGLYSCRASVLLHRHKLLHAKALESSKTPALVWCRCITLLLPGDAGLEIHTEAGWQSVPVVPDAFVINLGVRLIPFSLAHMPCLIIVNLLHRLKLTDAKTRNQQHDT